MTTAELLAKFSSLSALVVGDVCLDRWCTYDPALAEPSRETGIPRIGVVSTIVTPGAAGTIANNLAALGCGHVAVLGAIGDDGFGFELERALAGNGIASQLCVKTGKIQTFTYTKVLNSVTGDEDYPRLDFVNTQPLDAETEAEIVSRLKLAAPEFDIVLISDQAETSAGGVVTAKVRDAVAEIAAAHPNKVVLVDSRARVEHFRGVTLKPNQQEAEEASMRQFGRIDFPALARHIAAPLLMVTHGGEGVLLIDSAGERWVKTRPQPNPVDICGAGDSFAAGTALALAAGATADDAARMGNTVASITIMKKGTGTASPAEVLAAALH